MELLGDNQRRWKLLINGVRVPGGTLLDEEVMARFDSSPNAYKMKTEVKFKSSCCGAQ